MKLSYTIKENENFDNIKEVLKVHFGISNRSMLKLKTNNKLYLNGNIAKTYTPVKPNDLVEADLEFVEDNSNIVPTKMNLNIIYEDECMLVINKPAGYPVHPSMLHYTDSISNGVKYYFDTLGLNKKIRPVNRLDRDTSGLVIFAKNEYVQENLIKQMEKKAFQKEYIALCEGRFEQEKGTINAPIARKSNSIIERCVDSSGDSAITHYDVLNYNGKFSTVHLVLETGRTHQIRVHMSYIGHPILGDTLYGKSSDLIDRQALHSCKISFIHPVTRKKMEFVAPIPIDFIKSEKSVEK